MKYIFKMSVISFIGSCIFVSTKHSICTFEEEVSILRVSTSIWIFVRTTKDGILISFENIKKKSLCLLGWWICQHQFWYFCGSLQRIYFNFFSKHCFRVDRFGFLWEPPNTVFLFLLKTFKKVFVSFGLMDLSTSILVFLWEPKNIF